MDNQTQYMINAQGHKVPISIVKDIDKLRDQAVRTLFEKFKAKADELLKFRTYIKSEIEQFVELSAEQYNVKYGGIKGGITLTSYDGSLKIEISNNDIIAFTEQLQIARQMILNCVTRWSDGIRPEIKALVDNAFRVDAKGMVSVSRVLGLRSIAIEDDEWKIAMRAITDSIQVVSSRKYLRIYVRNGSGEYQLQKLDASAL